MNAPLALDVGQIWVPDRSHAAPRRITRVFVDVCGNKCVAWHYPENARITWSHRGPFTAWIARNRARLKGSADA